MQPALKRMLFIYLPTNFNYIHSTIQTVKVISEADLTVTHDFSDTDETKWYQTVRVPQYCSSSIQKSMPMHVFLTRQTPTKNNHIIKTVQTNTLSCQTPITVLSFTHACSMTETQNEPYAADRQETNYRASCEHAGLSRLQAYVVSAPDG